MPKVTINLKLKTFKALTNYSSENNKSIDQSIEEAITDFLDPGYEQDYDNLIEEATALSKTHKNINASFLQRKLGIGYTRALRLLYLLNES